ncbi:MAG: AraC family transcriptional regulator [Faecalicoccus sp.]|uniref:helix-turn-helix transcriptional regulator n=1 Tax=Faecalicoccus sp. TaxID=1971758 RepID=UPI002A91D3EA|nr:AraC family transcriptional regulator [Faecalicoccus sp.]MDY5234078.1 AraC family transcriptional regulator [Faecalicoccus sp.]
MIQSRVRVKEILACFYQRRKPNYQFLPSSHPYFEFTYIDAGKLYTVVDEKEYILHSSQCMVYYPNQKHTQYTSASSGCSYLTILFEMDMNIPDILKNKIVLASQQMRLEMKRFIKEIQFDSWMHKEMSLVVFQRILIQALLEQKNSVKLDKECETNTELDPILLYIENHMDKDISVEELCHTFSLSRSSLQVMFRNALVLTPKRYIVDVKMKRAKILLQEHRCTISEIAYQLGYHSLYYFSRKFKDYFGMSPSEYVKSLQQ